MKPTRNPITLMLGWLALAVAPSHGVHGADSTSAQVAHNTGAIEGRIQNELTGRYLNNSRVTVKGTDLRVFTDESGTYRLTHVPSGPVVLEVYYTGLAPQQIAVNVAPGQTITQNVNLVPDAVKMDVYVVGASKAMEQDMIAINEQRFAPNMKTVVSTGDLGEHVDGNIAEFLKFVPGVSTDDSRPGGSALSIRGFPDEFTEVTQNGAAVANAALNNTSRSVSTRMTMSITNIARVEVTKVPTPATGADSMAGSVNLVSRSAFENVRRELRYQVNLSGEHNRFSFKKKPSTWDDDMYFAQPSFSFAYTHPVNKNFGFTISGMWDKKALMEEYFFATHNLNSPTFGSSIASPFLSGALLIESGQRGRRANMAVTADWRVTPNSVLAVGAQAFASGNQNGGHRINFSTGAIATPTVAGGVQGSFGPDYTIGGGGRGSVSFQNNSQEQNYGGSRANIRYTFDNGPWKIDLQSSIAAANTWVRTLPDRGTIRNMSVATNVPLRVEFYDIDPLWGPGDIRVYDNSNQRIDPTSPSIHNLTAVSLANVYSSDSYSDVDTFNVDIRRKFERFPLSIQAGGARKVRDQDKDIRLQDWTYRGAGGSTSAEPFLVRRSIFGTEYSLVSPVLTADVWNKNPDQFFQTPAQFVAAEMARRVGSENITETADALYLQGEMRLLNNRLNVLTGVRYERTEGEGDGLLNTPNDVFVRNPDGSFALTPTGARIRRIDAGAAGSLEQLNLTHRERGAHSTRTYDGYYPSLHLTYNVTEKLLARAAYAKTYGRPNFNFIIPNISISEALDSTGSIVGGVLTMRNPGLLPWEADNYDVSLEYYTDRGGIVGASVFRKSVTNFFGAEIRDATPAELVEAGLEANDVGWEIRTTNNVGDARVDGMELNFNQSLAALDHILAGWGKSFRVFGNITKIKLSGDNTADFSGFLPTSANWGFQFARNRFGGAMKWNYRSDQNVGAVANLGANGFNYVPARTHLDINFSYNFTRNVSLFVQMRNVTRVFQENSKRSDVLPEYARLRSFVSWEGISSNIGIKGSF